jgi:putative glycosyltransferase (TIGR04372 family)
MTKPQFASLINASEQLNLDNLLSHTIQSPAGTYCVLGIRDSGFYNDNSIRSSTIDDYLPSIEMLLELGIPVIRMGRRVLRKIPIEHPLLFDYSFSEHVNDQNDILLWANARFAFGDSTGLTGVVGSFGSPIFMPTFPLDPRSFVSNENVYFATQSLADKDLNCLKLEEIVSLMNEGFNLGDERVLNSLGLMSIRNSPMVIHDSLQWFINIALNKSIEDIERTIVTQSKLTNFMASFDKDVYRHYRKDVLYSETWNAMVSHMWPKSINALLADNEG